MGESLPENLDDLFLEMSLIFFRLQGRIYFLFA